MMKAWRRMHTYDPEKFGYNVIVDVGGLVGEAQYTVDGEWWWANSNGDYTADPIKPDWFQPLPDPART